MDKCTDLVSGTSTTSVVGCGHWVITTSVVVVIYFGGGSSTFVVAFRLIQLDGHIIINYNSIRNRNIINMFLRRRRPSLFGYKIHF